MVASFQRSNAAHSYTCRAERGPYVRVCLCVEHIELEVSLSQDHVCGTVYRLL